MRTLTILVLAAFLLACTGEAEKDRLMPFEIDEVAGLIREKRTDGTATDASKTESSSVA